MCAKNPDFFADVAFSEICGHIFVSQGTLSDHHPEGWIRGRPGPSAEAPEPQECPAVAVRARSLADPLCTPHVRCFSSHGRSLISRPANCTSPCFEMTHLFIYDYKLPNRVAFKFENGSSHCIFVYLLSYFLQNFPVRNRHTSGGNYQSFVVFEISRNKLSGRE